MSAPDILPPELHLELRRVSLLRAGKPVLDEIDLCIKPNPAKTVLIGPNGAGKSLLLRLCHGLIPPDSGTIHWQSPNAGSDPSAGSGPNADSDPGAGPSPGADSNADTDLRRGQAMVFQRPVLLRRTAQANIDFALKINGIGKRERAALTTRLLRRTGLMQFARTPARALSFGEQQRLALARALATEPRILFLDEPTASLDPASTHLVETILAEEAARGVRIVMSTHDLNQARRMADEVIFLHHGRIREQREATRFFAGPENDLARRFVAGDLLWSDQDGTRDGGQE